MTEMGREPPVATHLATGRRQSLAVRQREPKGRSWEGAGDATVNFLVVSGCRPRR